MRARFIEDVLCEKFKENSDPIHDMGIGIEHLVKNFRKDLSLEFTDLEGENIFEYFPEKQLIEIDCWPLSNYGFDQLKKAVYKVIKNYKYSLEIINMPKFGSDSLEDDSNEDDVFIKIKIK